MLTKRSHFRGFTITEILVAIGTIIVLLAILLPALNTMRTQGNMAESESNLKQVATWLRMYSTDNREYICPTTFNYSMDPYPGHVCADDPNRPNIGTWTDILWTVYGNYSFPQLVSEFGHDYSNVAPDLAFYGFMSDYDGNPLRSAALNTDSPGGNGPTPFGTGAKPEDKGMPGYFAGNNFFNAAGPNATFNGWFVTGQIKAPSRSIYAVDSFYGETIEDDMAPWDVSNPDTNQVDFRYADACLFLMLDGSTQPEGEWTNLSDLEHNRRFRVTNLTSNVPASPAP